MPPNIYFVMLHNSAASISEDFEWKNCCLDLPVWLWERILCQINVWSWQRLMGKSGTFFTKGIKPSSQLMANLETTRWNA